jgi:hypothetical protein
MRRIFPEMKFSPVITLGLVLLFVFAQIASAQTALPLGLDNNYMVTGDYVVGGWTKTGSTTINGTLMSIGTIPIPDTGAYASTVPPQKVPVGADIVEAFLYWQSVEISGQNAGQNGFFNNGNGSKYPISGTVLGNLNAPVSWSAGGCAGSAKGAKTIVTYRAEVGGLLPVDANGNVQPNTTYQVYLPDTGKAGTPPFTEGATLLIVYRLLVPNVPLNAVVIYDGSYSPSNSAQTMTQPMLGFFQAGNDQSLPIATKITHIVGNGQSNKLQQVQLNNYDALGNLVHSTVLPSLYGTNPPFPGNYNGSWDNPTWFPNTYPTTPFGDSAVQAGESSETTLVVPNGSNKGCVSWGAIVMSTTVQDTDLDGILDVWKTNPVGPGYCDPGANRGMTNQGSCRPGDITDPFWVALPGATQHSHDIFIQLDYMCTVVTNNPDGTTTCGPGGVSYKPNNKDAMNNDAITYLMNAFSSNGHNINVHIVPDDNNVILAQTCTDNKVASPPVYCPFPGQAGVVGWKAGYSYLKNQPLNYPDETSCETRTPPGGMAGSGPLCVRRFRYGQNNSYHEAIFGVAAGLPNWDFLDGSLANNVSVSGTTLTFTTQNPHGLVPDPMDTGVPNGRITIFGAISNLNLNNTYLVQSVPTPTTFTIQVASGTVAPTSSSDPFLLIASGAVGSTSGVSDVGGADTLITLGLWGADGQNVSVESGTFMHELGHTLALTHGGLFRTPVAGGYSFSSEPNCKSNHQSVMNYLFQVDLLDGVLDYSEQVLNTLNESAASPLNALGGPPVHPTTKWYAPNQTFGDPATAHCDGTPLLQTDQKMFRLQGPANSISWAANQDINFDGQVESSLQGYNDWANIDLRQIGATGNDFWAGGAKPIVRSGLGTGLVVRTGRGTGLVVRTGRGTGLVVRTGRGAEADVPALNSTVRNPTNASASLTQSNTVELSFTPPGILQSLIAYFNVYRTTTNPPVFSKPAYATVPVAGMPVPFPDTLNFTDTHISCGVAYSYFVTTVLSDGRESVQSNTAGPISVPCTFVGFLSPLSTAGTITAPTFSGMNNQGSAVPLKWEILDANGNPIGDLSTLKLLQACPTTGSTVPPALSSIPPCVLLYSPTTGAKGNSTFRFSSPQFIFNWDTSSTIGSVAGYFTVELTLNDGSVVKATTIQFH